MASCRYAQIDVPLAVSWILRAMERKPTDLSLARDGFRLLQEDGQYAQIVERYGTLPPALRKDGKLKFYLANALAHQGKLEEAEQILYENGGLVVPVIREGEMSLTSLWYYIEEQKCLRRGEAFDETVQPPPALDYRMGSAEESPKA